MTNAKTALEETAKTTEIQNQAGYSYEYRVIDKKPRVTVYKDGVRIDGASFPKNYTEVAARQDLIDRNKTIHPGMINMKKIV